MDTSHTKIDQQSVRDQLEARTTELGTELRDAEAQRADAFEQSSKDSVLDSGDQGEQRTREIVLSAEEARDAVEIAEIAQALKRLDDGSYGDCVDCGVQIPATRLHVQPAAARCIDCQERHEKAQALRGTPSVVD